MCNCQIFLQNILCVLGRVLGYRFVKQKIKKCLSVIKKLLFTHPIAAIADITLIINQQNFQVGIGD